MLLQIITVPMVTQYYIFTLYYRKSKYLKLKKKLKVPENNNRQKSLIVSLDNRNATLLLTYLNKSESKRGLNKLKNSLKFDHQGQVVQNKIKLTQD